MTNETNTRNTIGVTLNHATTISVPVTTGGKPVIDETLRQRAAEEAVNRYVFQNVSSFLTESCAVDFWKDHPELLEAPDPDVAEQELIAAFQDAIVADISEALELLEDGDEDIDPETLASAIVENIYDKAQDFETAADTMTDVEDIMEAWVKYVVDALHAFAYHDRPEEVADAFANGLVHEISSLKERDHDYDHEEIFSKFFSAFLAHSDRPRAGAAREAMSAFLRYLGSNPTPAAESLLNASSFGEANTSTKLDIAEYVSGTDRENMMDEVYEHWAVSPDGARMLEQEGEQIIEINGLHVWCRCATGQSLTLDPCWQRIGEEWLRRAVEIRVAAMNLNAASASA